MWIVAAPDRPDGYAASRRLGVAGAAAADTIKIGEINSYKAQPAFLGPYKNGWNMALDEVNAAGGIDGKKLEVISRDDNGNPGDTVRVAQELVTGEQVRCCLAVSCRTRVWRSPTMRSSARFSSSPPNR